MIKRISPETIGKRYIVLDHLGRGAMGTVDRVNDRLTGQVVALKRVITPPDQLQSHAMTQSGDDNADLKLILAREFKVLASLRHPYIISVLDYGFDEKRLPYFTMELLEGARRISESNDLGYEERLHVIIQMFQSVMYLHRRGILHRDIKPSNVMMKDGQVRVLDFGISITYEQARDGEIAGTPSYMAPELWTGQAASRASDLYSCGVVMYEVLTAGLKPFQANSTRELFIKVQSERPNLNALIRHRQLQSIVARLLEKEPGDRFQDAGEVARLLMELLGESVAIETAATRESFLQAAKFVGRDKEINKLSKALTKAIMGEGSTWLVGGESGVGKTRLLDELRTLALVRGALVVRGSTESEGGDAYSPWRDILRWMSLLVDLDDRDAAVLKSLIPDIDMLVDRRISDATEVIPQVAQERLINVILDMFKRQQQPLVVILEDLQWAGHESLTVLTRLNQIIGSLPILVVGTFRDDETPDLPNQLPRMEYMHLARLNTESIGELVEAMLGPVGREPELLRLLQRETEGNVFFLVEVVRALAEEAGELDKIGSGKLPRHVFTGGVQGVIQRRLVQVPPQARVLLEIAAIAGRQLDLDVIREVLHGINQDQFLDEWLHACADAAVLDVQDERWQFAHNKLREGVLYNMPKDARQELHHRVATSIENVYQYSSKQTAAALAYHWSMAQDPVKEEHYSALAGEQALKSGAYQVSVRYLKQALNLQQQLDNVTPRKRAQVIGLLGDAYFALARYDRAEEMYSAALRMCRDIGYRWGVASNLSSLGATTCETGDFNDSAQYYLDALQTAADIRAVPVQLSILTGMATLLNKQGNKIVATEYLGLVTSHPAVSDSTQVSARELLNQLREELPSEDFNRAYTYGQESKIREVTARILGTDEE